MNKYNFDTLRASTLEDEGRKYILAFETLYKEKFEGKPISELTEEDYALYQRTGDRKTYERAYFSRRERLRLLEVLAIAKDEYVPALEELIRAICEEKTWLVPAHAYVPIDLFASETAGSLAETIYILEGRLSPSVTSLARETIFERIISVYENNSFWWDRAKNNWSAVCASGIGSTYLYLFPDRFSSVEARLLESFEAFLMSMDEEGYCYEGVNYWQYGFTFFCQFFLNYERMRGVRLPIVDRPKVRRILAYVENARMDEDIYLPFADGGYHTWRPSSHSAVVIRALYPDAPPMNYPALTLPFEKPTAVETLHSHMWEGTSLPLSDISLHYEAAGVFIRRRDGYSFAVKCGNNKELHNHNDVGAFQLVHRGERLISDFGAGIYTKEYFGTPRERYAIFACSARSHAIPIVDGIMESYGEDMRGVILSRGVDHIEMDIAGAYEGGPSRLIARYETTERGITVTYHIEGVRESVRYHFPSDLMPSYEDGTLTIGGATVLTSLNVAPTVTREGHMPHQPTRGGKKPTEEDVYLIDYEVSASGVADATFEFILGGRK